MLSLKMKKAYIYGILGGLALMSVYISIMGIFAGLENTITQMLELWMWILPLTVGFSIQVGLYTHMRESFKSHDGNAALATSGATSTGSMIACCAHHLTDVLPLLGFSAVSIFLTKFQTSFLLIGIVSNVVGVIYMVECIKKHDLYDRIGLFSIISVIDVKKMRIISMVLGVMVIASSFLLQR